MKIAFKEKRFADHKSRGAVLNNRVKYYPSNDFFYAHNFSKIEKIQIPSIKTIDINDALEFFQIKRYFDENARCKSWSDDEYTAYKNKSKELNILTNRFFSQIQDDNIINLYKMIEVGYHSDFWYLFNNCKLYEKISHEVFAKLIECDRISQHDLFLHQNIVRKYGLELKEYILSHFFGVSILLHVYGQDYTPGDRLYLPNELSGKEINAYLESYVESEHPHVNDLQTIVNMHSTHRFPNLTFTLDYPSILNNFIYVFEFVDFPQLRCVHVSQKSKSNIFERVLASKSSRIYPCNYVFNFMQGIAMMQMKAYYAFLADHDVQLEEVLRWFFTEYLQQEFGCPAIRVSIPTSNSTFVEKCSSIITAFESVLRQYLLYVKNGTIDFELLSMSSNPITFESLKSLVNGKYLYGTGKDYDYISYLLFSDQCMLHYVKRIHDKGGEYHCLIDLLLNEEIYLSDYMESDIKIFSYLADYDLIEISQIGQILIKSEVKLALLRDLFEHEAVNRRYYPLYAQEEIDQLIIRGVLIEGNTLFSQPEINYLNYLLNRAEYNNGLEIRNKYIHGIQQVNPNEAEHYENYLTLLRVFVLLAIKINEDFCLKAEEQV